MRENARYPQINRPRVGNLHSHALQNHALLSPRLTHGVTHVASISKHKRGFRAQVARKGVRRSMVFKTKQEAKDWAARQEYLILHGDKVAAKTRLRDVLDRYAREVSPGKRGHRWEALRLANMGKDRLGDVQLGELQADDIAAWRDRRLREVAPSSVRREMNLLGAVLTQARKEWRLLTSNPMGDVRKPTEPPARTRLPTAEEIERLRHVAGDDLNTSTARAFHAFLFSGESAMRAGEICGLTWGRIDLDARVAHLPMTKNGHARDVPMTGEAVALLRQLPELNPVFGLTSGHLDALWRKLRDRAAVDGLRFHDARAWALTKLSRKVDVLTLAKISGHRDLKMLLNVYYRETAREIAARLD